MIHAESLDIARTLSPGDQCFMVGTFWGGAYDIVKILPNPLWKPSSEKADGGRKEWVGRKKRAPSAKAVPARGIRVGIDREDPYGSANN